MRRLTTKGARGAWIAGLSIGTKLKIIRVYADDLSDLKGPGEEAETFDAEVIEKDEDKTLLQADVPDMIGGQIVGVSHDDGESLLTAIGERQCWFEVADEQPDHEEPPPLTAEVQGTGTALVPKGPRSVSWFLEQATILDEEAGLYRQYSAPQQALSSAASSLRSAVGHVMAGGCERPKDDKPDPF